MHVGVISNSLLYRNFTGSGEEIVVDLIGRCTDRLAKIQDAAHVADALETRGRGGDNVVRTSHLRQDGVLLRLQPRDSMTFVESSEAKGVGVDFGPLRRLDARRHHASVDCGR